MDKDEIEWFFQMRFDSIVRFGDGLAQMNHAGNYWQLVGEKSPFTEVLDKYQKGIHGDQMVKAIKLLKKYNILAQLMIMIGHENEIKESIKKTMEWVTDVVKSNFIITILSIPYPGTPMYEDLLTQGRIIDNNWTHYDMIHAICDMR